MRRLLDGVNKKKQSLFAVKSFSTGLLIILIGYYSIVLFHLPNPIEIVVRHGLFSRIFAHYLAIFFIFSLFAAGGKSGAIVVGGYLSGKKPNLKQSFISISFFLVGLGATVLSIMLILRFIKKNITRDYWNNSHWFWAGLFVFLFLSYVYIIIRKNGLFIKEALDNLKTIPIISPVFCFGGPVLFSKNLAFANLSQNGLLNVYSILSIIAGIIFLLFLVFYSFLKTSNQVKDSNKIILPNNVYSEINSGKNKMLLNSSFITLGIGIFLFLFLLIDVTIVVLL